MQHTIQNFRAVNNQVIKNINTENSVLKVSKMILGEIMAFRRVPRDTKSCKDTKCRKCLSMHLEQIIQSVSNVEAVQFVLPAFPGKSPNDEKVLGHMPDYAEKLSLSFLGSLCEKVRKYYAPGIKIILCSDGRVFSDVVGIKEKHITDYQLGLQKMIDELALTDISTFNLDDYYDQLSFNQMRDELMKTHSESLELLKHKVKSGAKDESTQEEKDSNRMYCGITRFLFEDAMHSSQTKKRSTVQKESRAKSYEVIRRSNAWSNLIKKHFPTAVRLSIHPQSCGSEKLGIRLIANESWMTPWHGVAVQTSKGFILLKRSEAKAIGAKLIYSLNGTLSHYKLEAKQEILIHKAG